MRNGRGCFSVGGNGCMFLIFTGLLGGWLLEYDLNYWVPILHRAMPNVINNSGPFHMSFLMWIAGFFLGGPALTVAIITFLLAAFGIIN